LKKIILFFLFLLTASFAQAQWWNLTPTPSLTPSATPIGSYTPTPTNTPTKTTTNTCTSSPTLTPTFTPSQTTTPNWNTANTPVVQNLTAWAASVTLSGHQSVTVLFPNYSYNTLALQDNGGSGEVNIYPNLSSAPLTFYNESNGQTYSTMNCINCLYHTSSHGVTGIVATEQAGSPITFTLGLWYGNDISPQQVQGLQAQLNLISQAVSQGIPVYPTGTWPVGSGGGGSVPTYQIIWATQTPPPFPNPVGVVPAVTATWAVGVQNPLGVVPAATATNVVQVSNIGVVPASTSTWVVSVQNPLGMVPAATATWAVAVQNPLGIVPAATATWQVGVQNPLGVVPAATATWVSGFAATPQVQNYQAEVVTTFASDHATGTAVSWTSPVLMSCFSSAVSTIGGSGAVTGVVYDSLNTTYNGWTSIGTFNWTGSAGTGSILLPYTNAYAYSVSFVVAASTTISGWAGASNNCWPNGSPSTVSFGGASQPVSITYSVAQTVTFGGTSQPVSTTNTGAVTLAYTQPVSNAAGAATIGYAWIAGGPIAFVVKGLTAVTTPISLVAAGSATYYSGALYLSDPTTTACAVTLIHSGSTQTYEVPASSYSVVDFRDGTSDDPISLAYSGGATLNAVLQYISTTSPYFGPLP
jgi:hypothetical protein